eukprot:TRINITY_DN15786_c0_g1_i3.p1 TRINITY_DN15786_c0_g1~~TRINITY_DN15786_c0_g1_i3.p1  ORF type:complete len:238 (-),score=43.11 TRINITY_DN15786_c0_g1_i3:40-753(-)
MFDEVKRSSIGANAQPLIHSKQRSHYKRGSVSEERTKYKRRNLSMNGSPEAISREERKMASAPKPKIVYVRMQRRSKRAKGHSSVKRATTVPHAFLMNPKFLKTHKKTQVEESRANSIANTKMASPTFENRYKRLRGNKDHLKLDSKDELNDASSALFKVMRSSERLQKELSFIECKEENLKVPIASAVNDYKMFMPSSDKSSDAFISNLLMGTKTKGFLFNSRKKPARELFKLGYL